MKDLVYKNERSLFTIACVLATLVWLAAIAGTFGVILIILLFFFLSYLFIHAGFIAWIKGNGIEISNEQFPELYTRFTECCAKLSIKETPRLFILNSDGILNAFATKFLRKHYVVLFSSVVDALERKPALIKFYIGHELGHIQRNHLKWGPFLAPVLWLPLLGSAYSRAREYTCDRYGLACSDSPVDACYALTVLASGERKWAEVKVSSLLKQVQETGGFWMSYHELTNDYPWLTKRIAHVVAVGRDQAVDAPKRNAFAYLFAFFTPRSAVPGGGGIFFIVIIIAILSAVAIPAYRDYQQRAAMAEMEAQNSASDPFGSAVDTPTDSATAENSTAISEPTVPDNWPLLLMQLDSLSAQYSAAVIQESRTIGALSDLGMSAETLVVGGIASVEFSAENDGFTVTFTALADDGVTPYWLQYSISSEETTDANGAPVSNRKLSCYDSNLPQTWWPAQCQQEWGQSE